MAVERDGQTTTTATPMTTATTMATAAATGPKTGAKPQVSELWSYWWLGQGGLQRREGERKKRRRVRYIRTRSEAERERSCDKKFLSLAEP